MKANKMMPITQAMVIINSSGNRVEREWRVFIEGFFVCNGRSDSMTEHQTSHMLLSIRLRNVPGKTLT